MTGSSKSLLQEAVLAVHCAAAEFTSVHLKVKHKNKTKCSQPVQMLTLNVKAAHRYKADGPTTDARNADTTPEPLPTSKHTQGLQMSKLKI